MLLKKIKVIEHETMLRSYSLPNFHHLPIWKNEPTDIEINQGETTKINCSAVVGPQYNSIKLQPVRAYWKNSQVKLKNFVVGIRICVLTKFFFSGTIC